MHRRIPILLYHSISAQTVAAFRPWVVHPHLFAAHMRHLAESAYETLTISELIRATSCTGAPLPPKPVVITFDDGFADFHEQALPVLSRHRFASTLYITTGFVGATSRWLTRQGEGNRRMLTWSQIREAACLGVECGAHSRTHPALDELPLGVSRDEIRGSKTDLESQLGREVATFAYPHGYASPKVRALVEEAGFSSAVDVRHAMSSPRDDPFGLARIIVDGNTSVAALEALLGGWGLRRAPFPEPWRTTAWRVVRHARRRATSVAWGA
ncbi:MAG: polysaccharide deacetylase family protein [Acidimicrobiales bacterium]